MSDDADRCNEPDDVTTRRCNYTPEHIGPHSWEHARAVAERDAAQAKVATLKEVLGRINGMLDEASEAHPDDEQLANGLLDVRAALAGTAPPAVSPARCADCGGDADGKCPRCGAMTCGKCRGSYHHWSDPWKRGGCAAQASKKLLASVTSGAPPAVSPEAGANEKRAVGVLACALEAAILPGETDPLTLSRAYVEQHNGEIRRVIAAVGACARPAPGTRG